MTFGNGQDKKKSTVPLGTCIFGNIPRVETKSKPALSIHDEK